RLSVGPAPANQGSSPVALRTVLPASATEPITMGSWYPCLATTLPVTALPATQPIAASPTMTATFVVDAPSSASRTGSTVTVAYITTQAPTVASAAPADGVLLK